MESSYNILGLNENATDQEVRARYIELARKHHPDKLINEKPEVRKENEEIFKKITVAYHKIINKEADIFKDEEVDEWINKLWGMFNNPELWDNLKKIVIKVAGNIKQERHKIEVKVSLEDIYNKKKKKLRLFLNNVKDPVFCDLDCSKYPGYIYNYNNLIEIDFTIHIKKHKIYYNDDLINIGDLYTTIMIKWDEYINGTCVELVYLDNTKLSIEIEPFTDLKKSHEIKNKGLFKNGNLYICYELINPKKINWELINNEKQKEIINALKSLGC
jgi:DnaJ-class molecular chaperone